MRSILSAAYVLTILTYNANANEINITIEGQGSVSLKDSQTRCNESCTITSTEEFESLVPQATDNWVFKGWSNNACEYGNGIVSSETFSVFDNAKNGAKTLDNADVNGDGIADFAAIDLFARSVTILTNNGDGTFSESNNLDQFTYPSSLAFYDWESDGDQDLLVSDYNRKEIKLFTNDGNGEFSLSHTITFDNIKPYGIAVADINEDSEPELLISSFNSDTSGDLFQLVNSISSAKTAWYSKQGDEYVESILLSDQAAFTLDTAVVDGQILSLAAELKRDQITLYSQTENNITQQAVDTGDNPYGATFGDIDDNGTLDVLAAYYRPSKIRFIENTGNQNFIAGVEVGSPVEGVTATAIADINNDGIKDLALGEFNTNRFYYFPTQSYKECVVNSQSPVSVTAFFESTQNGGGSADTESSDSSGGSLHYFMALLALVLFGRRFH